MLGWFVAATAVVVGGGVGLFWRAVGPGLSQQRSAAVGGGEQGRAELSGGGHPPARPGAMERPWAGAETGAERVVRGLKRWSWRPRQRRWWCWDLAPCCRHLLTGRGRDLFRFLAGGWGCGGVQVVLFRARPNILGHIKKNNTFFQPKTTKKKNPCTDKWYFKMISSVVCRLLGKRWRL